MDVFSPGWSCQDDPKRPSSRLRGQILKPGSLQLHERFHQAAGKWLLPWPLRQKPLPIPAARRLDVVSMEIDVRSAKNRASV